jgi:hypothetical protein
MLLALGVGVVEVVDPSHRYRPLSLGQHPRRIGCIGLLPHPFKRGLVVVEQPTTRQAAQVQHWRVRGWRAVDVGVDQHVVVEPVDRVVERGGMEAQLDPWSAHRTA